MDFHVSTQAGVVRQTERHLHSDPPRRGGAGRAAEPRSRAIVEHAVPAELRGRVRAAIAVAGTATSCAAIEQELEPYDPARVTGYVLTRATLELLLRRPGRAAAGAAPHEVPGLDPDRAPDDRGRRGDPARGDAAFDLGRGRGVRARHPPRRGARPGIMQP